jgi:hypothetical protein
LLDVHSDGHTQQNAYNQKRNKSVEFKINNQKYQEQNGKDAER